MDYYLKADSEADLWRVLTAAGAAVEVQVKDTDNNVVETRHAAAPGWSIDLVGVITKPTGNLITGQYDGKPVTFPEVTTLSGFHANLRGPGDLAPTTVTTPYQPTTAELLDPAFVMPPPTTVVTPSILEPLLVYPTTPTRTWF